MSFLKNILLAFLITAYVGGSSIFVHAFVMFGERSMVDGGIDSPCHQPLGERSSPHGDHDSAPPSSADCFEECFGVYMHGDSTVSREIYMQDIFVKNNDLFLQGEEGYSSFRGIYEFSDPPSIGCFGNSLIGKDVKKLQ